MSLVSLVNLAERILNQSPTQGQDAQTPQNSATTQFSEDSQEVAEDQFTPSAQSNQGQASAQAAGLFSVARYSFFSAAADFLLGQNAAPQTNSQSAPAAPATDANVPTAQTALTPTASPQTQALAALVQAPATANVGPNIAANTAPAANTATSAANTSNVQTAPTPTTAAAPAAATATTASPNSASTQEELQALNTSLEALGLSPQDIQQLDQIASIINDYNPTAFTSLAYQLEALSQQTAQPTTANAATAQPASAGANSAITNATAPNPAASNGTPANGTAAGGTAATATAANSGGGGFQVQKLIIKFSGLNAQANTAANGNGGAQPVTADAGNTNGNQQISTLNLQIEEVNLTLVNDAGQTAQIQAPA